MTTNIAMTRPRKITGMAIVAVAFGLLTIFSGGKILFGGQGAKIAAGDYVPFVLWFNFLAGFAYVAAGAGLLLWRKWAVNLTFGIAALTLLVFAGFCIHVLSGSAYEARTVGAMILRSGVWIAIAFMAGAAWKKTRAAV